MLPGTLNIEMMDGDGYRNTLTFTDSDDDALDLSSYTFSAQIRKNPKAEDAVSFIIDDTDADTGVIVISLTGDQVRSLFHKCMWDMEYVIGDSDPTTVLKGTITIYSDITRVVEMP